MFYCAMTIQYYGKFYCGWQKQRERLSIQELLECALSRVANHSVKLTCAGRTDSGVHATSQVVSFLTHAKRNKHTWIKGTNSILPKDIQVISIYFVDKNFNARFDAVHRRYNYLLSDNSVNNVFFQFHSVFMNRRMLNINLMNHACYYLLGKNDFTSFRSSQCQSSSPICVINHAFFFRIKNFIIFDIQGSNFLHHMVRNILGSLFKMLFENRSSVWFKELLEEKNRRIAGKTMPARGLYLVEVGFNKLRNISSKRLLKDILF